MSMRKIIVLLMILALCGAAGQVVSAQDPLAPTTPPVSASSPGSPETAKEPPENNPYYAQFFTEKVFTVSKESDGLMPGTLRASLIQASGIRSGNNFILVKIVFDPTVKRVRITKGALPEIDGALTTIDCQTPSGRGIIEGAIEDTEGLDPAEEMAGLKITSTGNTIRNCHITGFSGPGIAIRGTRNLIEYNTIGYHKDSTETSVPASIYDEPKTNNGPGILIGAAANANTIQNNEIVANTYNGVELATGVGAGNKILFNLFAKNSGKPVKSGGNVKGPQITKIVRQGDQYLISGSAENNSEVQLYIAGKDDGEVGMNISSGVTATATGFQVTTKSKGFVPNHSKIFAISHSSDGNSSEFSPAQLIPGDAPPAHALISASPASDSEAAPAAAPKTETAAEPSVEKPVDEPGDTVVDVIDSPDTDSAHVEEKSKASAPAPAPSTPANVPNAEAETTLNVKGLGEKGGQPESSAPIGKSNEVSSLGI